MSNLQASRSPFPSSAREAVSPLDVTLTVCGRLAGAQAALLALDGTPLAGGHVATMAGRVPEWDSLFVSAGPCWIDGDGEEIRCTMLARVAPKDGSPAHLLALSFADALPMARARVERLLPDLIALVGAQLDAQAHAALLEERHCACAAALDDGNCGVIAVRDDHSVLFANPAAEAILGKGAGLQIKRGTIRPADYRHVARFEAALDAVQAGMPAGRGGKTPGLVMMLPGEQGDRPLVVVVVPVRKGPTPAGGASALIYLIRPDDNPITGLDAVAELHGLSGVERRLLGQLYAGLTVAESAARMRIKLETGRAYLKQIFVKTGTHRQSELVTLMNRYQRAMRGDFDFVAV